MSAKSVCEMSCGAMHEFALVLDKAGFDADLVHKIVNSKGNKHAKKMYTSLASVSGEDERFELVNTFEVTVPEGYNHATHLDTFRKAHEQEFYYYNPAITDKNYGNATTKLVPGRKFQVKVFQIKETVSSDDCLGFLKSQKAVLVGAQGASLAYEQRKDKLPVDRWSVSFDEKKTLWKDAGGYHRVPDVYRYSDGVFKFHLGSFVADWLDAHCLLCFCDLEPESSGA